jgi:Xaa-Pro aminopeptidase
LFPFHIAGSRFSLILEKLTQKPFWSIFHIESRWASQKGNQTVNDSFIGGVLRGKSAIYEDEMNKISQKEYLSRQKHVLDAMEKASIDLLFLLPGSNFFYLTGLKFPRERHRLLTALFSRKGRLVLMGISFEESKLRSAPVEAEVLVWSDEDNQHELVAHWIRNECGDTPRIGVELTTNYYHYLALQKALPGAKIVDPTVATDEVRAIKSNFEIACLREAAQRTRARMAKVPSQLTEGMTEIDLVRLFGPSAMIQFGLTTSMPNEVAGLRKLSPGDAIVIDAGDRVEGYRSDLTRTFFFGEPSARMREIYNIVNEAELAAIDAAHPGAPSEVVDLAARRIIEKAGYGEYFTHRGGHGIGLDFHELPICVAGNKAPLRPGMVLTAEPGIYLPGEFGIRLEDDLLITETGCELLCDRGPLNLD